MTLNTSEAVQEREEPSPREEAALVPIVLITRSSNLVTDETTACETITLWTSGLEKLPRLI